MSVLLCNYNDAHYLPDSLTAICTQTRPPEEVVVLDDGSTDDSLEIIEEFRPTLPLYSCPDQSTELRSALFHQSCPQRGAL